jgi:hypothetical protein
MMAMMSVRQNVRLLMAVVAVNVMSLLDAISTILLSDDGSFVELNPVMSAALENSLLQFLAVKLGITLVGTLACWHCYERIAMARGGLHVISRLYCLVMVWQGLLLTEVIR